MTQPRRPVRDPYGLIPAGGPVAPLLALAGLVVVALVTLSILGGNLPFVSTGGPNSSDNPLITPAPSDKIVVPSPAASVPGVFTYVKQGNVWIQHGTDVRELTTSGSDSTPSFSNDGTFVYFIRTVHERALAPSSGRAVYYDLTVPSLMRVKTDGSAQPERILDGSYTFGPSHRYTWFTWLRQPVMSPDGKTIALVSDAPDPFTRDVVLQLYDVASGKLTVANAPESAPLGHQDPAWRPDGRLIAYVRNGRDGARGAPAIWRYDPKTRKAAAITGAGYEEPSWSPDGRYLAATKTTSTGTDVVILDAQTGTEVLRVTNDARSWAPQWSQAGDGVAFLNIQGQIVDLRVARLSGPPGSWTVGETTNLTTVSGLEGASRPDWFIPESERPAPAPSTAPSAPAPSGTAPSEIP